MPIANCVISSDCLPGVGDLIELWSRESGQSKEHMTVNLVTGTQQHGKKYAVMATLWLPSIWSKTEISSLQSGLARALATYHGIALSEVHVITQLVNSGMVVEEGNLMQWSLK